jgi:hypothetical protein
MIFPRRNFRKLVGSTAIVLTSGLLAGAAVADTIYKSVDAQGNVTFSNTPPPAGVEAQQIELQPGPTPAEQQQSVEEEQNLEAQSNEIPEEESAPEQEPEEPEVQPVTEYQQDAGESDDNEDPVVVDEGYVDDRARDEVARDRVEDPRAITPGPTGVYHPQGGMRR